MTARFDNQGPWWLFGVIALVFFCFVVYCIASGKAESAGELLPGALLAVSAFAGFLLTRPAPFIISIERGRVIGKRRLIGHWYLTSTAELNADSQICIGQAGSVEVNIGSFASNTGGHVFIINGSARKKFFTNTRSSEECLKVCDFLKSAIPTKTDHDL